MNKPSLTQTCESLNEIIAKQPKDPIGAALDTYLVSLTLEPGSYAINPQARHAAMLLTVWEFHSIDPLSWALGFLRYEASRYTRKATA